MPELRIITNKFYPVEITIPTAYIRSWRDWRLNSKTVKIEPNDLVVLLDFTPWYKYNHWYLPLRSFLDLSKRAVMWKNRYMLDCLPIIEKDLTAPINADTIKIAKLV